MIDILSSFDLTPFQWFLAIVGIIFVGISKTGIGGAGMLSIPILASIFGGKPSAGLLLPILCVGDIIGVAYYNRHTVWKYLIRLLPWALAGIVFGTWVGNNVSDRIFTWIIAVIILVGLVFILWREKLGDEAAIPDNRWFAALMGFIGGFASMMGNAAVPPIALYFLSMRIPKMTYIGTWAWFFMLMNATKVPFHIFFWHTITPESLAFDLVMLPAVGIGALIGVAIVKKLPEHIFRWVVIAMTAIASIRLFF